MADSELAALGLQHITRASYQGEALSLVHSLRTIHQHYKHLLSIDIPPSCGSFSLRRILNCAPVNPTEAPEAALLSDQDLCAQRQSESRGTALAETRSRCGSTLGKLVIDQLAGALGHKKGVLMRGDAQSCKIGDPAEAALRYLYSLFCVSPPQTSSADSSMASVDRADVDLLLGACGLSVPRAELAAVLDCLDPDFTGYVSFESFCTWLANPENDQRFRSKFASFRWAWDIARSYLVGHSTCHIDAERALLTRARMRKRAEIDLEFSFVREFTSSVSAAAIEAAAQLDRAPPNDNNDGDDGRAFYLKLLSGEAADTDSVAALWTKNTKLIGNAADGFSVKIQHTGSISTAHQSAFVETDCVANSWASSVGASIRKHWARLQTLALHDTESENAVLYTLVANQAERDLKKAIFRRRAPELHCLEAEQMLMDAMEVTFIALDSYAAPQTENSAETEKVAHHRLLLELVLSTFDVDCSGDLDEEEALCALACLRGTARTVTHADLLFHFPEFKLQPDATVSTERLADFVACHCDKYEHLAAKNDLSVSPWRLCNRWQCATNILVCERRQQARRALMQTVTVSRSGAVFTASRGGAGENDHQSLIWRSQLLAMRQVAVFLSTTHGRLKLELLLKDAEFAWDIEVAGALATSCAPPHAGTAANQGEDQDEEGARNYDASCRRLLLQFAVTLHCERGQMLITELPFLFAYLVEALRFRPNRNAAALSVMVGNVRNSRHVRWLSVQETLDMIDPLLESWEHPPASTARHRGPVSVWELRNARRDAECRMRSCARQQAVLVALSFQDIDVPETNYRCSVLGLRVVTERLDRYSSSGTAAAASTSVQDVVYRKSVDWDTVPREAAALYLLYFGCTPQDLQQPALAAFVALDHSSGSLKCDPVSVPEMVKVARCVRAESATAHSWTAAVRKGFCAGTQCFSSTSSLGEYQRVVVALELYGPVVDKKGGDFLGELLSGVSHCADDSLFL